MNDPCLGDEVAAMSMADDEPTAVPCGGCGAMVVWTITEAKGKWMCVDAEPSVTGNLILMHKAVGKAPVSRVQSAEEKGQRDDERQIPAVRLRFTNHFANCPAAAKYRKRA